MSKAPFIKNYVISPCKGCPDRCVEPNCHTSCEKYLKYKSEQDMLRTQEQVSKYMWDSIKEASNYYWDGMKRNCKKKKDLKKR